MHKEGIARKQEESIEGHVQNTGICLKDVSSTEKVIQGNSKVLWLLDRLCLSLLSSRPDGSDISVNYSILKLSLRPSMPEKKSHSPNFGAHEKNMCPRCSNQKPRLKTQVWLQTKMLLIIFDSLKVVGKKIKYSSVYWWSSLVESNNSP